MEESQLGIHICVVLVAMMHSLYIKIIVYMVSWQYVYSIVTCMQAQNTGIKSSLTHKKKKTNK